tara:strand:- start:167 stop:343 length:177 start_codon:yes stop_codon:yes gene_type:complete
MVLTKGVMGDITLAVLVMDTLARTPLERQVTAMDLEVLEEQLEGMKAAVVLVLIMDYL